MFKINVVHVRVVTDINGHKLSSEIIINNATQTKSYGIRCYLVCAILLFTLFKFDRVEDCLIISTTVYLCDHQCNFATKE